MTKSGVNLKSFMRLELKAPYRASGSRNGKSRVDFLHSGVPLRAQRSLHDLESLGGDGSNQFTVYTRATSLKI